MTPSEINRKMAEFMGWEYDDICDSWYEPRGGLDGYKTPKYYTSFDPYNNIADAMMIADKFERYHLDKFTLFDKIKEPHWFTGKFNGKWYEGSADTAPKAICLAVMKMEGE